MVKNGKVLLGKAGETDVFINLDKLNRHGMIAGATGTGKTVTLKVLAESFSDSGIPVFMADVKGDLSGTAAAGIPNENVTSRVRKMGLEADGFSFKAYPVTFWDVYGEKGIPLRTTISEMGPLLLSRILDLNDVQSDILTVVFKIADDQGLLLTDTKDLKALLAYVSDHRQDFAAEYGNIAPQSVAAITRAIVALESEGGDKFFGEPALSVTDWLSTDLSGRGQIQVLNCQKLILNPAMYSSFLLWMLSELYENLPEVGDLPKPKMVFFFDEAHMLFDTASDALLQKVEQVVKLIRSKGVGIFFVTQNPADIPDGVMSQLGNKIQHALRAYSPKEVKAVKAAAETYRPNPAFDTQETILNLGTGEAIVSLLGEDGIPGMVERVKILPPQSMMGALDDASIDQAIKSSLLYSKFATPIDRESAYEMLQNRVEQEMTAKEQAKADAEAEKQRQKEAAQAEKEAQKAQEKAEREAQKAQEKAEKEALKAQEKAEKEAEREKQKVKTQVGRVAASAAGTVGREVGNSIGAAFGGKFGKKIGGNVGAQLGRSILGTLFGRK